MFSNKNRSPVTGQQIKYN